MDVLMKEMKMGMGRMGMRETGKENSLTRHMQMMLLCGESVEDPNIV